MATIEQNNNSQNELVIQKLLRTGGFLFPQTVEEVIEFEKRFGATDYSLPEELKTPLFLKNKGKTKADISAVETPAPFALAARGGMNKISDEVRNRMEEDRKAARKNR